MRKKKKSEKEEIAVIEYIAFEVNTNIHSSLKNMGQSIKEWTK